MACRTLCSAFAALALCTPAKAQDLKSPKAHALAGLQAAVAWPGYASLCALDSRMRNVNLPRERKPRAAGEGRREAGQGGATARRGGGGGGGRGAQPLGPMQVFDNLYVLGTSSVMAWLYGTPEGYILIDGLNSDEEAQEYILDGMQQLGLDPAAIRHIVVSHAHGDHYGGADYLAEQLGVPISMTAPDWALAATLGEHPRFGPAPTEGITVEDGQVLVAGETEMTLHMTPGHTPGTLSPLLTLQDGDDTHKAVLWGGTGFNFGPDVQTFLSYARSAAKMREIAAAEGVGVFISGHARRDGSAELLEKLASRAPDETHPFVRGAEGQGLFTVLEQCALAQAARFTEASPE